MRRWLSRLLEAPAWAQAHPDLARRIIAADTGLPEDFVEAGYSYAIYKQLDVTLGQPALRFLKHRHDQLLADGFIEKPLDIDSLIAPEPLRQATDLQDNLGRRLTDKNGQRPATERSFQSPALFATQRLANETYEESAFVLNPRGA